VWSEEELIADFTKEIPELKNEVLEFWNNAGGALWQYDFTKDWLKDLKTRGYQVLFLSNWSYHLKEQAKEQLDFLPLMDGGVFSCDVKMVKPDHGIYNEILKKYNLTANECVFLDDKEPNVIAARECGLYAIHVTSHEAAVKGLEKLLAN
jgi:putative hydrolase of the HAD superfamily